MRRKKLKFASNLVPLVLSGEKNSTWRLWDDKNLSKGDVVDFLESGTGRQFAAGRLITVAEKPMSKLTKSDKSGHEKFESDEEMYEIYSRYYKKKVGPRTKVKVIKFKLMD